MEMKHAELPGIQKPISRLVMGTMMVNSKDLEGTFGLLDDVYALGANAFDTAHVYGEDTERTLGRWIAERGVREQVMILGKGAHPYGEPRVNPECITSDLHDSLERLATDYIDLYMLHRDDAGAAVGPIVEVLNRHLAAGLINAFGGSNWSHQRIQEANDYAAEHGLTPFTASSPNLTLAEQVGEPWGGCLSIGGPQGRDARQWYRASQMPVFAWSSLARGLFSGRVTRENYEEVLDEAARRGFAHERNFRRLDRARELAQRRGVTVPQVAMAYVMSLGLNVFPLVGCMSRRELEENIEALYLDLSDEEAAWLDLRDGNDT